jgi:hypothetical protein
MQNFYILEHKFWFTVWRRGPSPPSTPARLQWSYEIFSTSALSPHLYTSRSLLYRRILMIP